MTRLYVVLDVSVMVAPSDVFAFRRKMSQNRAGFNGPSHPDQRKACSCLVFT